MRKKNIISIQNLLDLSFSHTKDRLYQTWWDEVSELYAGTINSLRISYNRQLEDERKEWEEERREDKRWLYL